MSEKALIGAGGVRRQGAFRLYARLTRHYLDAFESDRGQLATVIRTRVQRGRLREEVITNVVAAVAPSWCAADADRTECASFLSDWSKYADEICSEADGRDRYRAYRYRRYPIAIRQAFRDGLRLAAEAESGEPSGVARRRAKRRATRQARP
jgi:hypothetical protein